MEKDDLIYVTDFKDVYIYKTEVQKVVHKNESSYFKEPEEDEEAKILLYRCEGDYGTEWRRIVYGSYIKKERIEDVDKEILGGLMIEVEESIEKKIGTESSEADRVAAPKVEKNKNIIDNLIIKIINLTNQIDFLPHLFLKVYGFSDSYPFLFFILVFSLLIIYYFI